MNSTPSSRSESVVWPSMATASILQVRQLANELRELRRKGESSPVRAILERYPDLAKEKSVVIELANEDFCQRSEAGERINLKEYCNELPVFQDEVRKMAETHGWFEEKEPLLDDHRQGVFPDIGKEFLGFSLLRELGRGTFACVYLAAEPSLGNRLVAVKVAKESSPEAEILGRLTHRNIVPIHSAKKDPQTGYTVVCMPYLGSATLCDLLSRIRQASGLPTTASAILEASQDRVAADYIETHQQLPDPIFCNGTYVDGVLKLGLQLAEALAFIHSLGICHCDLKPSNVLLRPDGRPMLLDFNLSFREQPVDHRLGGTFPYMAPEFLRAMDRSRKGFPAQVDARSDVFSLGVMLCEVLTGLHPLGPLEKQDSYENLRKWLLERQGKGIQVDWSKNPRVDSRTRDLLDRCLAYRPEDRPQTAAEVARGLRYSLSAVQRFRRWASLNVRLLVASAALLGGLIYLGLDWSIPKEPYAVRQFNKGLDLYRLERFEEAGEYFTRAARADSRNGDIYVAQGRNFLRLNQFGPAEEAFLAAERVRPEGRVEACLSYCSAKLEHYDIAIAQGNAAIEGGFKTAEVLNNRGYSLLQRRDLENAEIDFVEAIRLDNGLQAPHYNLALLELKRAYEKQDHKSACRKGLEHIQSSLEIGPERADLYYTGAKLYSFAAEKDSFLVEPAIDFLRNAIRLGLPRSRFEADFAGFKGIIENTRVKHLAGSTSPQLEIEETPRLLDPIREE